MEQQIAGIKYDLQGKQKQIRDLEREVFLLKKKNEIYDKWLTNLSDLVKHNLSKQESNDIQNAIKYIENMETKVGGKSKTKKTTTKKPSTKKPSTKKNIYKKTSTKK